MTLTVSTSIVTSAGEAGRYFRFSTHLFPSSPSDTDTYDRNAFDPPVVVDGEFIYKFPWILNRTGDRTKKNNNPVEMTEDDELGGATSVSRFFISKVFGDSYVFRDGVTFDYAAEGVRHFVFGHRYTEIHDEIKGWPETAGSEDFGFVVQSGADAEVFRIPDPDALLDANATNAKQQEQANEYGKRTVESTLSSWAENIFADVQAAYHGQATPGATVNWAAGGTNSTYDVLNALYKGYQTDVEGKTQANANDIAVDAGSTATNKVVAADDALTALEVALRYCAYSWAEDFNTELNPDWRGASGPLSDKQSLKDKLSALLNNFRNGASTDAGTSGYTNNSYHAPTNYAGKFSTTALDNCIATIIDKTTLISSVTGLGNASAIDTTLDQLKDTHNAEWTAIFNKAVEAANVSSWELYLDEDREGIITKSWGKDYKYEYGIAYEWGAGPDKDAAGNDYDDLRKGKHQTYSYGPRYEEKLTTKKTGKIEDYPGEAPNLGISSGTLDITVTWSNANVERTLGDAYEYYSGSKLEVTSGHKEEHVYGDLHEHVHASRRRHAHKGAKEYIYEDSYEYTNGTKIELLDPGGAFKNDTDAPGTSGAGWLAKREWSFGGEESLVLGEFFGFKLGIGIEVAVAGGIEASLGPRFDIKALAFDISLLCIEQKMVSLELSPIKVKNNELYVKDGLLHVGEYTVRVDNEIINI